MRGTDWQWVLHIGYTGVLACHSRAWVRHSDSKEVNMIELTCHLHCKQVSHYSDFCCFVTKSSRRFRCTVTLNPAFSVAPIESPRHCGPSPWRTTVGSGVARIWRGEGHKATLKSHTQNNTRNMATLCCKRIQYTLFFFIFSIKWKD